MVAIDRELPPYSFIDADGRLDGFSVEMVRSIAEVQELEVEFRPLPTAEIPAALAAGEVDFAVLTETRELSDRFLFSLPHEETYASIFTREDVSQVRPTDLLSREVLVARHGPAREELERSAGAGAILVEPSVGDALRRLAAGDGDCALVPYRVGSDLIRQLGLSNLRPLGPQRGEFPASLSFAARRGGDELMEQLDLGLSVVTATDRYSQIYSSWFQLDDTVQLRTVLGWLAVVSLPLMALLGAWAAWSWSLRKTVARRTADLRFTQYTVDHVSDTALWVRPDGVIFYANEAACRSLDRPREELLGAKIYDIDTSWDRQLWLAAWSRVRTQRSVTFESVFRRRQGALFPVEISASFAEFENEECVCLSVRDISERKRAQEVLAGSEKKYRGLFDSSLDAIALCDMDGRWIDANPACLKLLDYPRKELSGRTYQELTPEKWRPQEQQIISEQAAERGLSSEYEKELIRKNGEVFPVSLRTWIVENEEGEATGTWSIIRDLTEAKRAAQEKRTLEAQIQQAQKLESLGVLAGGIAHDFNNLLMGVLGNAGLALLELGPESPVRGRLRDVEQAGRRAAELCKQMLAYSGKGKFVVEPLDLAWVVRDMTHLLKVSISKKASLVYNFEASLPTFEADATQIRQVVMNLITNASDALGEETGSITVTTGVRQCDEAYLRQTYLAQDLRVGLYVYLEVADTGCGMDSETRERMFDPFFSTKFTGRGLGLAATLGIVRGHRGALEVETFPGEGTVFRVLFPCGDKALPQAGTESTQRSLSPRGDGTVLVVDDEQMVLNIARRVLERAGYRVITARDGEQGWELFRSHLEEISVVLLDVTMPRMNGEETFHRMRQLKQDIPVILSSGYDEQEATGRFTSRSLAGFLQKPYTPTALLEKIRQTTGVPSGG